VSIGIIGRRCQEYPKKLELGVQPGYPQPKPFQANPLWKPNPLWKGKAIAWWVATSGPDANSTTATTTIAIALRVILLSLNSSYPCLRFSPISTMSYIRRMYYEYTNTYYIYTLKLLLCWTIISFLNKNITGSKKCI
jgi:hypothetical protein